MSTTGLRAADHQERVIWDGSLGDHAAGRAGLPHLGDPRDLGAFRPDRAVVDSYHTQLRRILNAGGKSILLVGNDPFVGWLASDLTGRGTALARGELLCLARRGSRARRWRVLWNIAEESPTLAEELRAKIKSKMDSAKALGAVLVALLTFLLTRGLTSLPSPLTWLAVAALGCAALLYFGTLFLYDSLLMPHRFWGSRLPAREWPWTPNWLRNIRRRWAAGPRAVQRPPASTERLLHDAMTHVWTWVFQLATALVGVGVALLAAAGAAGGPAQSAAPSLPTVVTWIVGIAAFATLYLLWHRPRLGASD